MRSSWTLAFVLTGMASAQTTATQTPAAQRCFSHDPDLAIAGCTALLQSGHETQEHITRAFSYRGAAYIRKREYDRAVQDLDQAIQRDPNYAQAFESRGTAYSLKGQNDRAIEDFSQSIHLDPKSAVSFYDRGGVYNVQGQHDRAIQDFDEAIRLKPDLAPVFFAATYHERGLAYFGKGEYQRAIQDYDQAIRLYPNLTQAVTDRGAAQRALGQQARAEADIAKAKEQAAPAPAKQPTQTPVKQPTPTLVKEPTPTLVKQPTPTLAKEPAPTPVKQQLALNTARKPTPTQVKQQPTPTPPPPSDVVADGVAKPPLPAPVREVTVEDLQKVTEGMSREQLLKLGAPTGRITMDEDGHLIEIFQYSANGTGLGTVRVTDGAVSGVRMH
jgi:tetratricopeptide (TPR) repeat protein